MKVLIFGAAGQVGAALAATAPPGANLTAVDRSRCDLTQRAQILGVIDQVRPDLIFNAAAYTAVDRAESEPALAERINGEAVGDMARGAGKIGAQLVHISTDFVFDGASGRPYRPEHATNPLSVYGATKRDGETLAGPDALIVRTSWVYAAGGANFVRSMLRLMRERTELGVVCDQIGAPTFATGLARALWALAADERRGVFHYTDSGVASWYDFACAIREEAMAAGLLDEGAAQVLPISTTQYPTPAKRPAFSVLDSTATWSALGKAPPHWRTQLRTMLDEVTSHG